MNENNIDIGDRVDLAKERLEKGYDDLDTAKKLYDIQKYNISCSTAFYAAFHVAKSILALDEIDFKKQEGVVSYICKEYVNTNKLPKDMGRLFNKLQNNRHKAQYKDYYETSQEKCKEQINNSESFISEVSKFVLNRIEEEKIEDEILINLLNSHIK